MSVVQMYPVWKIKKRLFWPGQQHNVYWAGSWKNWGREVIYICFKLLSSTYYCIHVENKIRYGFINVYKVPFELKKVSFPISITPEKEHFLFLLCMDIA